MKQYYRTAKPLPANAEQLQRICRATSDEECQAIASVLGQFFKLSGDVYRQKRIDEELERVLELSYKRQKAALSKGQQVHSNSSANAQQMPTHLQSHIHIQDKIKSVGAKNAPSLDEVRAYCLERGNEVDPESFWNFYASKGWMIGKNPVKNWKFAVHTWERRNGNGQHAKN
jgi:uncharacterized protein YdaU (DUF1376 family)